MVLSVSRIGVGLPVHLRLAVLPTGLVERMTNDFHSTIRPYRDLIWSAVSQEPCWNPSGDAIDRGRLRPKPAGGEGIPCLASVLRTAQEIAAACSYLHDNGIVHGDL